MNLLTSKTNLLLFISILSLTQSTILITSPAINPFTDSKIPYAYTNLGTIPYGKTLTFDLVTNKDIDFCLTKNKNNASLFVQPTYVIIEPTKAVCSYVTLAINAQQMGAKGVIIVSDLIDFYGNMVPIDDGNGRKVHISVLMITNQTYLQLQILKNIQIKVQYEVYKKKIVDLTFFLSGSGRANYIFLREFQPYYEKISNHINFKPIYLTFECPNCDENDCLISSDYCMFEMDAYADGLGELILKQQIRQWNIFKQFGTAKYLSYMNEFDKYCTTNWIESQNCGNEVLKFLKFQSPKILQSPSEIMDEWRKEQVKLGFFTTPQLTINSQIYAGTQDPEDVFYAICSSLIDPPSACLGESALPSSKSNIVGWIIGSIVIACLLSIVLGFWIYKRCVKKELTKDMFSKVNQLVARYATKVSEHNKKRKEKLKMRLNEEL